METTIELIVNGKKHPQNCLTTQFQTVQMVSYEKNEHILLKRYKKRC